MLPTPTSTSQNPRPTLCTAVAARYTAGSLAVCRVGSVVALHFGTTSGEMIVTMRVRDFIRSARGRADHNGNVFPTIEQLDEERRLAMEEIPAPAEEETRGRKAAPDTTEKCEAAWLLVKSRGLSIRAAAEQVGVPYPTFGDFVRYNHRDEAKKIRSERASSARWTGRAKV